MQYFNVIGVCVAMIFYNFIKLRTPLGLEEDQA